MQGRCEGQVQRQRGHEGKTYPAFGSMSWVSNCTHSNPRKRTEVPAVSQKMRGWLCICLWRRRVNDNIKGIIVAKDIRMLILSCSRIYLGLYIIPVVSSWHRSHEISLFCLLDVQCNEPVDWVEGERFASHRTAPPVQQLWSCPVWGFFAEQHVPASCSPQNHG